MTRVFLPDHYLSYQIARALLIDTFIPRQNTPAETIEAQKRVSDYIVQIDTQLYNRNELAITVTTQNNKLTKQFKSVADLIDYLNNS